MRETSCPLVVDLPETWNITDFVERNARECPDLPAYRRKTTPKHWATTTWSQFREEVVALAKGLVASGVGPGDRIGIMSRTRYEWTLFDVAAMYAGAVTVPVYETSSVEQIEWIANDAGMTAILVEDEQCETRVRSAQENTPDLKTIWVLSNGAIHNITQAGTAVAEETVLATRSTPVLADVATIIYTSGTTGNPKGCEITHGNLSLLAASAAEELKEKMTEEGSDKPGNTLLFITLAHVFARYVSVLCMAGKCAMGHTSDIRDASADMKTFKPTFLLAVPRVFEKVYNTAEQRARTDGKGKIFTLAAKTAVAYSTACDSGKVSPILRAQHKLFDLLVYRKLRDALGGNLRFAVSGSAPLGTRLGHFFRGAGVTIVEGYGLTESTAPACVNRPEDIHMGTVGPPLPGCDIRIAEDGEILLRGIGIFKGYHNNPEATAESLQDGWLHTGDMGTITDSGSLQITGRKKEIIITAGGKNVAPTLLEDRLRMHPLVSQCIVVGDAKPFIAALITLDSEMLPAWLRAEGKAELSVTEAMTDEYVQAALDKAVERANRAVSRAESIRKFTVLPVDFTVDSGHLTPSMKLKRRVILTDFATDVDELYKN